MATHAKTVQEALRGVPPSEAGQLLAAVEPREFARMTRVLAHFSIALSLPALCQLFIGALIILSDGEEHNYVEVTDIQLALFMRSDQRLKMSAVLSEPESHLRKIPKLSAQVSHEALMRWVGRIRKGLIERQKEVGVVLIECNPGGVKKGERFPSKYRLHIFDYIQQVQEILLADGEYIENYERAIEQAVLTVLKSERELFQYKPKVERFRRSKPTAGTYEKLARTYFEKAMRATENRGEFTFPLISRFLEFIDEQAAASDKMGRLRAKKG